MLESIFRKSYRWWSCVVSTINMGIFEVNNLIFTVWSEYKNTVNSGSSQKLGKVKSKKVRINYNLLTNILDEGFLWYDLSYFTLPNYWKQPFLSYPNCNTIQARKPDAVWVRWCSLGWCSLGKTTVPLAWRHSGHKPVIGHIPPTSRHTAHLETIR